MKLYYLPGACPLASQIVLEWMNLPYELQAVSREELKQPAFLALNPIGSVPVFQDGDFTLTQSVAIVEYLAEFAEAMGIEVPQLFRDPNAPTRDELLKGYSDEELTSAIQLIDHTRAISLQSPNKSVQSSSGTDVERKTLRAPRRSAS